MAGWEVYIGAAIAFAGGAIGTGWAQSRIGAAGAGAIAERPETAGSIIILEAIPETLVILGFVVAAMMLLLK
jgi:V/A-type H+/Na+-transporting ATPase subunit K